MTLIKNLITQIQEFKEISNISENTRLSDRGLQTSELDSRVSKLVKQLQITDDATLTDFQKLKAFKLNDEDLTPIQMLSIQALTYTLKHENEFKRAVLDKLIYRSTKITSFHFSHIMEASPSSEESIGVMLSVEKIALPKE